MTTPVPTAVRGTLLEGRTRDGTPAAERISMFSDGAFFVDWYALSASPPRFTYWTHPVAAPRTYPVHRRRMDDKEAWVEIRSI